MSTSNRPVLVTGASGKLGRQIVENLISREGVAPGDIVAGTRDPAKLADLAARGVQVRRVDFDDEASLDAAFKGVARLLIISTDAMDRPRADQHIRAVDAARRSGVGHVLYTSIVRPEAGSPVGVADDHLKTEQAIIASGIPHTLLRHGLYLDNLLWTLPSILGSGVWYSAAGDGVSAHVSREDCARADAAALAADRSDSRAIDVTGPEGLSHADIAALATDITGKTVNVVQISADDMAKGIESAGMPAFAARLMTSFDTGIRQGYFDVVSSAVSDLTSVAPTSFRSFIAANKAALAG